MYIASRRDCVHLAIDESPYPREYRKFYDYNRRNGSTRRQALGDIFRMMRNLEMSTREFDLAFRSN